MSITYNHIFCFKSGEPGASHLGLFDQQSSKEEAEANDGCIPFCYNVYAPGRHFRKSNPGTPCYTLAITSWSSPLPSAKSMERYRSECDPESIPLIAVTGPGSDVSYYQLKGLVTPLWTNNRLFASICVPQWLYKPELHTSYKILLYVNSETINVSFLSLCRKSSLWLLLRLRCELFQRLPLFL